MPGSRLFIPGSVGPAGPAGPPGPPGGNVVLKNQGVALGPIATLDVEGTGILASLVGTDGTLTVPPPPAPAFGYWSGGETTGAVATRVTNKLGFNTDSVAMTAVGLLVNAINAMGLNSGLAGYFAEGANNGPVAKLLFATDGVNMTSPVSFVTNEGFPGSGNGINSGTSGYFAGFNTGGGIGSTHCFSIDFAADVNPLLQVGSMAAPRQNVAGANSITTGYWAGGDEAGVELTTCEKITFATDANPMAAAGALTVAVTNLGAANSNSTAYFAGGFNGGFVLTNSGLSFATDTVAMVAKGSLVTAREALSGANSTLKGYFAGGFNAGVFTNHNDALTFATDAVAMVAKGALTQPQGFLGACQSGGIL
jgi:hypothetical protein